MKFTLLFALLLSSTSIFAQIDIQSPSGKLIIEKIVRSIDGEGVIIQNITTNQLSSTNQLAQFEDGRLFTGMEKGMLLSTGSVKQIGHENISSGMTGPTSDKLAPINLPMTASDNLHILNKITPDPPVIPVMPNTDSIELTPKNTLINSSYTLMDAYSAKQSDDADMKNELGGNLSIYDACIVEMDIIPLGDTLSFRYMFASEEYDEYVGTRYNDAFAFFISGPGLEGKKNLAVLESGSRVTVNSINNGNPGNPSLKPSNPSFYNRNTGQIPLEYDGFTRTLEIMESVEPFKTYHLKIIIVDAGDGALDSGVFIEEGSVISYDHKFIIPFNSDISSLDTNARKILLSMMQVAQDHPEYVLQITGHTDSDGSESSNLILSQNRINSVIDFLSLQGFSKDDIRTVNKGESMPMTTNETDEGKKKNRRVEIKLIPSDRVDDSNELSSIEITSYPNPCTHSVTIDVQSTIDLKDAHISVYSTNGKLISEQPVHNSQVKFQTSEWEEGIYFYSLIHDGKKIASNRFVKVNR